MWAIQSGANTIRRDIQTAQAVVYQLLDRFITTRAAGSVNNTASEPGGTLAPMRVVADTTPVASVANEQLIVGVGGGANNPNLTYNQSWSRLSGRTLAAKCYTGNSSAFLIGWSTSNGTTYTHRANWNNGNLRFVPGFPNVAVQLHNSPYWYFLVLRTTGAFLFLLGADFSYPTLIYIDRTTTTTPLYPAWSMSSANGGNLVVDDICIPDTLLPPTALASDDFARSNGGLGSTNSYDTGNILAWNDRLGTGAVSSNTATWSALTSTEGLATIDVSKADVFVIASVTRAAGVVGLIIRYADANNYVRVVHDGTNVVIIKRIAGVETTVSTTAATHSAGADLVVVYTRTNIRVYYNTALINASTLADAGIQTGTNVGIYSTSTSNTIDNFSVWAIGTANEHGLYRSYGVLPQTKPVIFYDGDSLTAGAGTTVQSYPYQLSDLIGRNNYDYYNIGISGQVCADLLTDRTYSYGALIGIWNKHIVDLWIGSNDLASGRSASNIYTDITTLVQYYQGLGAKVLVNTIIPRTGISGANETARLALNVLINANTAGADTVVDLAADSRLQDFNNTTYFLGDKTHLTATGNGVVAALQQTPITAL